MPTTNGEQASDQHSTQNHAGKFLMFSLGGESYGLEILKVQEIIGIIDVTSVPRTADYVRGVINLRGKVIPVIDLRIKFEMEPKENTDQTCIIVLSIKQGSDTTTMGIIVDNVAEVVDIPREQIEPPPEIGLSASSDFILGMGKVDDHVSMLVNADRILSGNELSHLSQST